jgi:hypothetical protein
MKKTPILAFSLFMGMITLKSQVLIGFETSPLASENSFWNGSDGLSNGISEQSCFFPTNWDTSFGGYWAGGFALSNMTDSVTSGFTNMYSAKAGSGYALSAQYAVAYGNNYFSLSAGIIDSMRITNNTYAYNSMRDGDQFAKKFGGLSGNDPDYFRVVFKGYLSGNVKPDSVTFYLADYRFSDNTQDYLVRDWTAVSLATLGEVDSVTYRFESSDVGIFLINTPTYFCLDALEINTGAAGIKGTSEKSARFAYPNPSHHNISFSEEMHACAVFNSVGKMVMNSEHNISALDCSSWDAGVYLILARNKKNEFQQTRIVVSH